VVALNRDLDLETWISCLILQVDDYGENDDGRYQVHDIWETLAPEGLVEGTTFVVPGEKQMEEGDDGTLKPKPRTMLTAVGQKAF